MTSATMRALTFAGPASDGARTSVTTVPRPVPAPGEVLIRVTHAGINYKDVMMRRGDPAYVPGWPVVPGLEIAGVIEQAGDGVDGFEPGTRVIALTNTGGLAEYVVAGQSLTTHIPAGTPSEIAAVVPGVWTTAWLLLHEAARVRSGETILVHSASGAVGTAVAAIARTIPATTIIGVVGAASRLPEARQAGYELAFVRDEDLVDSVLTALVDARVDVVLDPQGTTWLDADLRMLAPAGRVVLFGNASGAALEPLPSGRLFAANASVGGFSIAGMSATAPARVKQAMDTLLDQIARGTLTPRVAVTDGLDQAAALQQQLADGTASAKHVIRVVQLS